MAVYNKFSCWEKKRKRKRKKETNKEEKTFLDNHLIF